MRAQCHHEGIAMSHFTATCPLLTLCPSVHHPDKGYTMSWYRCMQMSGQRPAKKEEKQRVIRLYLEKSMLCLLASFINLSDNSSYQIHIYRSLPWTHTGINPTMKSRKKKEYTSYRIFHFTSDAEVMHKKNLETACALRRGLERMADKRNTISAISMNGLVLTSHNLTC